MSSNKLKNFYSSITCVISSVKYFRFYYTVSNLDNLKKSLHHFNPVSSNCQTKFIQ